MNNFYQKQLLTSEQRKITKERAYLSFFEGVLWTIVITGFSLMVVNAVKGY